MALVTLSNPGGKGLDLAVLGNPPRRRRKRSKKNPIVTAKFGNRSRRFFTDARNESRQREEMVSRLGPGWVLSPDSPERSTSMATRTKKKRRSKIKVRRRASRVAKNAKRLGKTYRVRGTRATPSRTIKVIKARRKRRGTYKKKKYAGIGGKTGTIRYKARVYGGRKRRTHSGKTARGSKIAYFTNPRHAKMSVGGYFSHLMQAPGATMTALQANPANALWLTGGAIGTYLAGGFATRTISPMLASIPGLGTWLAGDMGKRVVSGLMPYTLGWGASMMVKDQKTRFALVTGGAVASIVSFIAPNALDNLIGRLGLPGVEGLGSYQALASYFGDDTLLAGYVNAPNYAGTEGYVDTQAYAGTQGYVEVPNYAGTEGYLDQPNYLEQSYLAGS